jgi:hypothetical protein
MIEKRYYKFGLRVKPSEDEAKSFEGKIQAIIESNLPKMINEDINIF